MDQHLMKEPAKSNSTGESTMPGALGMPLESNHPLLNR